MFTTAVTVQSNVYVDFGVALIAESAESAELAWIDANGCNWISDSFK